MNNLKLTLKRALLAGLCFAPGLGFAFDSGSTGADGAFSPTADTQLQLPESGVLNFTTVNIPAGVTVTFKKNTTNTPVTILASGNVIIAGTLSVAGGDSPGVGTYGDGNLADDGLPGVGGPGGYSGGSGGKFAANRSGGAGLGPGGGGLGYQSTEASWGFAGMGGSGAGHSVAGSLNRMATVGNADNYGNISTPGIAYGSDKLLPLIGGSGGGGGAAGTMYRGSGGGGGGGAILIASSGTVSVEGTLIAKGGNSGSSYGAPNFYDNGASGGGGSGGAIRIVAKQISGDGIISALGGTAGTTVFWGSNYLSGGNGANGFIRLEPTEYFTRTAATTPAYIFNTQPGPLFLAGAPTLSIVSVAGVTAPVSPTGSADITLPDSTPNPVTVVFKTTGVPAGNAVKLTVTPPYGAPVVAVSTALSGDTTNASASVSIALPTGPSVMAATVSYTVVAAVGDLMSVYAQGERVEKIVLAATFGGSSTATLITVSGKEYAAPATALALAGINS